MKSITINGVKYVREDLVTPPVSMKWPNKRPLNALRNLEARGWNAAIESCKELNAPKGTGNGPGGDGKCQKCGKSLPETWSFSICPNDCQEINVPKAEASLCSKHKSKDRDPNCPMCQAKIERHEPCEQPSEKKESEPI